MEGDDMEGESNYNIEEGHNSDMEGESNYNIEEGHNSSRTSSPRPAAPVNNFPSRPLGPTMSLLFADDETALRCLNSEEEIINNGLPSVGARSPDMPDDFLNAIWTVIDLAPELLQIANNILNSYINTTLTVGMVNDFFTPYGMASDMAAGLYPVRCLPHGTRTLLLILQERALEINGIHDPNISRAVNQELHDIGQTLGIFVSGLSPMEVEQRLESYRFIGADQEISPEDDDSRCSICLEKFATNDELGRLDCGHEYHYDCIKLWLVLKNLCPLCFKIALAPPN